MDARLVKVLLRCVQSDATRFTAGAVLDGFVNEYGRSVGERRGQSVYMNADQKENIRRLLISEGVTPDTPPDAWDGLTRTDALQLSHNEKFAQAPVKRDRVAVKALSPQKPLFLNSQKVYLPARCHVEVDYHAVHDIGRHDWIVVVENWECFNDIDRAVARLSFPGDNPIIVWRGDKDVRADNMMAFLRTLALPVAAFVDYDPAGMVIALSLPRLQVMVSPSLDELANMMKGGLIDRYSAQLPGCQAVLNANHVACVDCVWQVIRTAGRALSQEIFLSTPF